MDATNGITPAAELEARVAKLQAFLADQGLDGALIVQNTDLFYWAGTIQQAHLYIPVQGEPLLMVRKSFERARAESALRRVVALDSPKQIPGLLRHNGLARPRSMGLELDVLPANLFFLYQRIFQKSELLDVSTAIRQIRAIKSDYELDLIREAARRSDQVADLVRAELKAGMTELELAGKVEAHARRLGHQGIIRMRLWGSELFYGHLMSGPSAAVPSYLSSPTGGAAVSPAVAQGSSFRPIKRHEPVLVDYVFAHNGYLSDHARIFALGPLPDDLVQAHNTMIELHATLKAAARPGTPSGDLYTTALEKATAAGYGDYFMGVGDQRIRFVGHGVGLELDEFPFLAQDQKLPLAAGMVIALEPKLVIPGRGVVGIENTHIVTSSGLEQLTLFPEEIITL
jgi:Xaa-Pro aminopeptidase